MSEEIRVMPEITKRATVEERLARVETHQLHILKSIERIEETSGSLRHETKENTGSLGQEMKENSRSLGQEMRVNRNWMIVGFAFISILITVFEFLGN